MAARGTGGGVCSSHCCAGNSSRDERRPRQGAPRPLACAGDAPCISMERVRRPSYAETLLPSAPARSQFVFETEGSLHTQPHTAERGNERGLQRKLTLLSGLQAETVRLERKQRQESSSSRDAAAQHSYAAPQDRWSLRTATKALSGATVNRGTASTKVSPTHCDDSASCALLVSRKAATLRSKPTGTPWTSSFLTQPPRSIQPGL